MRGGDGRTGGHDRNSGATSAAMPTLVGRDRRIEGRGPHLAGPRADIHMEGLGPHLPLQALQVAAPGAHTPQSHTHVTASMGPLAVVVAAAPSRLVWI